ncbi:hypothetical protein IE81DRAFT_116992 [Ceraceosorus guamensis]|uniref:Uncharacterized protein n=1 Tax=Ceraceosorus guamensis TaxID=1522189 RepID=A0A316VYA0_9BASI|nr:hypothetical protein IE81DRAFT_116992 [Ceraceosorus guamensis]PWN42637.1 hypothetical protein IE81DRAFT_116992 [Ceraceosorus guamensis]
MSERRLQLSPKLGGGFRLAPVASMPAPTRKDKSSSGSSGTAGTTDSASYRTPFTSTSPTTCAPPMHAPIPSADQLLSAQDTTTSPVGPHLTSTTSETDQDKLSQADSDHAAFPGAWSMNPSTETNLPITPRRVGSLPSSDLDPVAEPIRLDSAASPEPHTSMMQSAPKATRGAKPDRLEGLSAAGSDTLTSRAEGDMEYDDALGSSLTAIVGAYGGFGTALDTGNQALSSAEKSHSARVRQESAPAGATTYRFSPGDDAADGSSIGGNVSGARSQSRYSTGVLLSSVTPSSGSSHGQILNASASQTTPASAPAHVSRGRDPEQIDLSLDRSTFASATPFASAQLSAATDEGNENFQVAPEQPAVPARASSTHDKRRSRLPEDVPTSALPMPDESRPDALTTPILGLESSKSSLSDYGSGAEGEYELDAAGQSKRMSMLRAVNALEAMSTPEGAQAGVSATARQRQASIPTGADEIDASRKRQVNASPTRPAARSPISIKSAAAFSKGPESATPRAKVAGGLPGPGQARSDAAAKDGREDDSRTDDAEMEASRAAEAEAEADNDPSRPRTLKEARALAKERARLRRLASESGAAAEGSTLAKESDSVSPSATQVSLFRGPAVVSPLSHSSSVRHSIDRPRRDPKRTSDARGAVVSPSDSGRIAATSPTGSFPQADVPASERPGRSSFASERSVSEYSTSDAGMAHDDSKIIESPGGGTGADEDEATRDATLWRRHSRQLAQGVETRGAQEIPGQKSSGLNPEDAAAAGSLDSSYDVLSDTGADVHGSLPSHSHAHSPDAEAVQTRPGPGRPSLSASNSGSIFGHVDTDSMGSHSYPSVQTNTRRFGHVSPSMGAAADGKLPPLPGDGNTSTDSSRAQTTDTLKDLQDVVTEALEDLSFGSSTATNDTAQPRAATNRSNNDLGLITPRESDFQLADKAALSAADSAKAPHSEGAWAAGSMSSGAQGMARAQSTASDALSEDQSNVSFSSAVENPAHATAPMHPLARASSSTSPTADESLPRTSTVTSLTSTATSRVPVPATVRRAQTHIQAAQRVAANPAAIRLPVYGRTTAWPVSFDPSPIIEKRKLAPWERARAYAQYANDLASIDSGLYVWLSVVQRPAQAQNQTQQRGIKPGSQHKGLGFATTQPATSSKLRGDGLASGRASGPGHARETTGDSAYAASIRSEATFPIRGDGGRAKEIVQATPSMGNIPESPPGSVPSNIPYPTLLPQSGTRADRDTFDANQPLPTPNSSGSFFSSANAAGWPAFIDRVRGSSTSTGPDDPPSSTRVVNMRGDKERERTLSSAGADAPASKGSWSRGGGGSTNPSGTTGSNVPSGGKFFGGLSRKGSRRGAGPASGLSVTPMNPSATAQPSPPSTGSSRAGDATPSSAGPRGPRGVGQGQSSTPRSTLSLDVTSAKADTGIALIQSPAVAADSSPPPPPGAVAAAQIQGKLGESLPDIDTRGAASSISNSRSPASARGVMGPRPPISAGSVGGDSFKTAASGSPVATSTARRPSQGQGSAPNRQNVSGSSGLGGGESKGLYYGLSSTGGIYGVPKRQEEAIGRRGSDAPPSPTELPAEKSAPSSPGRAPTGPVKSSFSYGSVRERSPNIGPGMTSSKLAPPASIPTGGSSASSSPSGGSTGSFSFRKGSFSSQLSGSGSKDSAAREEAFEEALNKLEDVLPDADRTTLAKYLKKSGGDDLKAIGDYLQDQARGKLPQPTRSPTGNLGSARR